MVISNHPIKKITHICDTLFNKHIISHYIRWPCLNIQLLFSGNRRAFFSVSLHATFADKLKTLKPGELMIGRSLAFINKELQLFEAMEYLAGSPLSDAILRPEPHHFIKPQEAPPLLNTQVICMKLSMYFELANVLSKFVY